MTAISNTVAAETSTTRSDNDENFPMTVKDPLGVEELFFVAAAIALEKTVVVTDVIDPFSKTQERLTTGNKIAAAVTVALLTAAAMTRLPTFCAVVNVWHL